MIMNGDNTSWEAVVVGKYYHGTEVETRLIFEICPEYM
jgi:hypothetical protein